MAKSGHAAVELLLRREPSSARPTSGQLKNYVCARSAFRSCRKRAKRFTGVDLIVLSPGVPVDIPPVERTRARRAFRSSAKWNWPVIF